MPELNCYKRQLLRVHAGYAPCVQEVARFDPANVMAVGRRLLVSALKNVFVIKHFGGHREYPNQLSEGKICPGNIGMELVRNIRSKTQLLPPPTS